MKRHVRRGFIAAAAAAVLLAQPLLGSVSAVRALSGLRAAREVAAASSSGPGLARPATPPPLQVGEQADRRTATSTTRYNADHTFTTKVYGGPVNYRDRLGHWQPIDSTLVSTNVQGYAYQNRANSFQALFSQTLGNDYLRLVTGDQSVSLSLVGAARSPASVKGASIEYANVLPQMTARYRVGSGAVEETLVLQSRSAAASFRFLLKAPAGSTAERLPSGSWSLRLPGGAQSGLLLSAPLAYDSGPHMLQPGNGHAEMAVEPTAQGFQVDLALDQAWLADPGRRFPVFLDPTIVIQPDSNDAAFAASCSTCTPYVDTTYGRMYIGTDAGSVWREALQFDLSAVPAGVNVTSASLGIFYDSWWISTSGPGGWTTTQPIDAHLMTGPWSTSSTTAQVQYDPTVLSNFTLPVNPLEQWMTWDVSSAVNGWISGTLPNYGLYLMRSTEPLGASGPAPPGLRYSGEASLRPQLTVTYSGDAVQLNQPSVLHSNGAELSWSQYTGPSGAPFQKYEVHRSATANFTPSAATLLTSIGDYTVTSYRDSTAAPNGSFYYAVVANSSKSNEIRATLPADGQATMFLQPGAGDGKATYIRLVNGSSNCFNYGASPGMVAGADSSGSYRTLLRFDLHQVPTGAGGVSAQLSLWHYNQTQGQLAKTLHAFPLTSSWKEGTGLDSLPTCTGDGATWYETTGGTRWVSEGGDFDASVASSQVSIGASDPAQWSTFDVSGILGRWVSGQAPNLGFLVKQDSESLVNGNSVGFHSDDYTGTGGLHPKLQVTYNDGSHASAPTVAVAAPGPGAMVSGSTVALTAAATDDHSVSQVQFFVDGTAVGTATASPWSVSWDSTQVGNGGHTLTAVGTDDAGNVTSSSAVPLVSLTVNNNPPPTTSITGPANGSSGLQGTVPVTTSNSVTSGLSVSRVELYLDGALYATSTAAPYSFSWNTLDPALPAYDGSSHSLTSRVYDSSGLVATSAPVSVTTANTASSEYAASFSTSPVPQAVSYDPGAGTQLTYPVNVTVTNTSRQGWNASSTYLHYRWYSQRPGDPVIDSGDLAALGLSPGASTTVQVPVSPPALPDGVNAAQYRLRFDVVDTGVCPSGWVCTDVGQPAAGGGQSLSGSTWTVQGGGGDIWGTSDQFHFVSQSSLFPGGTLSARVVSQTNTDPWAKAGVMVRQSADGNSAYYAVEVTPGNGVVVQYRVASGASAAWPATVSGGAPAYVRVARADSAFSAYTSSDGVTWTLVPGSTVTLNVSGAMMAGLAVTSHNASTLSTATFDNVGLGLELPGSSSTCPGGWTCRDVGGPALAGGQSVSGGTWTVQGAGGDIWGTSDQFHFDSQVLPGDGTVSAHVTSQTNTDPWAKAGVMLRQTADASSAYYAMEVTPGNGVVVQYRSATGASAAWPVSITGTVPAYVRVARSGSTFTAYTSSDGVSWTAVANSSATISVNAGMLAGLAVTSHNTAAVSTATFDGVSLASSGPPGWTGADIGAPALAGSQLLNNGTWTVQGGGADIWGSSDQFHFVSQSLDGDSSVTARVSSQTNTDPWAKAGVMLRQTSDPSSAYYALEATPGNGIVVQYRSAAGASAAWPATVSGTAPAYLRIARLNTTFTAYTSTDGTSWRLVPNSSVTLSVSGPMLAGLAVTSHNTSALSTATFDGVSLNTTVPVQHTAGAFGDRGNPPLDNPVIVNKVLKTKLGLEHYYQYTSMPVGAGMTSLVNVANGNSILNLTPLSQPGWGLSTVAELTYNSLEEHSESPAGNNWSLSISSLARFGKPLDIHPNSADTIAGRSNKFIEFVDADGSLQHLDGVTGADGVTFWKEPPGVHLYLRAVTTDTANPRYWAITRPDRSTFYFSSDGYPTFVRDRNGNELSFTLTAVQPGDDPGGPKFHVTKVTDAAGQGASPAPNRSFNLTYFTKATARKPQVRGKVASITDHLGHELDFSYYDDGNLLGISEKGGSSVDGSSLTRSWIFTYTTSDGSGPAIPNAAARVNPDPKTPNQSTRVFSVRDPLGHETLFTYNGPTTGQDRWKLASIQDRAGASTGFSYDDVNLVTTVAAPTPAGQTARTTRYAYDVQGRPTTITDPLGQPTSLQWSADNAVTRLTEPNTNFRQFAYNDNGYPTDLYDQLGNHTLLTYQNLAADANDTSAHWNPSGGANGTGRTVPHLSQLATRQEPKEVAAGTQNKWSFTYDGSGNLTQVTEPLFPNNPALNTYNSNGTLASSRDFNGNLTTFASYDANGLPTRVIDASDNPAAPTHPTQMGYDDGGRLLFVQDPNHASFSAGTPAQYQTQFFYDSFNRLARQTTPKSTSLNLGTLIVSSATYDANDNLLTSTAPHCLPEGDCRNASQGSEAGTVDVTSFTYDTMDRRTLVTGPDTSADPAGERTRYQYDLAGRVTQVTLPLGVQNGTPNNTRTVNYAYDALDRVTAQTRNHDTGSGIQALNTLRCYDAVGNLVSVTAPRAGLGSISCPGTTATPFTTVYGYDAAHRLTSLTAPLTADGQHHQTLFGYDQNGNRTQVTDANNNTAVSSYDALNRLVQVCQPFITGSSQVCAPGNGHPAVTVLQYDANGNLTSQVSPRGYDAAPAPKTSFSDFVTSYHYDGLNRLVRTDLPVQGTSPHYYVHSGYDPGGNLVSSSLPVTASDPGQVAASSKTQLTRFDPGWIASSQDPGGPRVHFDYTGKGEQRLRTPEGGSGAPQIQWSYFPDGLLQERRDQQGQPVSYAYDAENHLVSSHDASGLTTPLQPFIDTRSAYDDLGRMTRSDLKKANETNWTFSSFAYDADDNVTDQVQNGQESTPGGTLVRAGRSLHSDYDQAGWITTQLDFGTDPGSADDQRTRNSFTPIGLESTRAIDKSNGSGGWTPKQVSSWSYFANGKLWTLSTTNGSGSQTLESHTVGYLDPSGLYVDGNRTTDSFKLKPAGANSGACYPTVCNASYGYDPRDRLSSQNDGRGTLTTYDLDPSGNIQDEKVNGNLSKQYTYQGSLLQQVTAGGVTSKYWYDDVGRLHCVTTAAGSAADCSTAASGASANLLADYEYDYLDRLQSYQAYSGGGRTDYATYTYDALDRLVGETELHPSFNGNTRSTQYSYLGLGGDLTEEQQSDSGGVRYTKDYSYDAYGHRLSQTVSGPAQPNGTFTYGYDVHGSVSQLLDANGSSVASYGYQAYGQTDSGLSQGDPDQLNPRNPFRYSAKHVDTGSGSVDMGVRRFGPDVSRFLTPDLFYGALSNLALSLDPITQNRYGLAGGNPIGFREWDGHMALADGGGGAATTPSAPSPQSCSWNPLSWGTCAGNAVDWGRSQWSNVTSDTSQAWSGIESGASQAWSGIESGASQAWSGIESGASQAWSGIQSGASQAWSGIQSGASWAWSGIQSGASWAWSGIQSGASWAWNTAVSLVTSATLGICINAGVFGIIGVTGSACAVESRWFRRSGLTWTGGLGFGLGAGISGGVEASNAQTPLDLGGSFVACGAAYAIVAAEGGGGYGTHGQPVGFGYGGIGPGTPEGYCAATGTGVWQW